MADGYKTAGNVLSMASPMLNAVPYIGPLLSMGASIGGGLLEQKAAKEQAAQADKMRRDALNLKPEKISKYYTDKLRADKMAALSGLPGYGLAKNAIDANIATGLRAGAESSESGAQRLALASALIGTGNKSLNDLSMADAEFKAGLQKEARGTMQMLGDKEYQQQLIRDEWKQRGLEGASAMENAATANRIGALNKIMGAVASTGTSLLNQAPQLGEMIGEQKIRNIQMRANKGEQLTNADLDLLKKYGITLDSIGLGSYEGLPK